MGYAIISQMKIKSKKAWNGITAHNSRTVTSKNINTKLTHKNITLIPNQYQNQDDFIEKKRTQIREHNKKHGTKNRMLRKVKNKVSGEKEYQSLMQELVFTHSPGEMTEEESVEFLKMALEFIKEFYPDCEIIYAELHLDETTPHLHIGVSYFNQNLCKFEQQAMQKRGMTDINVIRDAWQNKLKDTKFDKLKRQDGKVVAKQEHQAKANLEIARLKKENKTLAAHAEKTALLTNLVAVKAQTELAKQTALVVTAREGEERIRADVDALKVEVEEKTALAEKTPKTIVKEVVKLVEDETRLKKLEDANLELKARLDTQDTVIAKKDSQIANLSLKLKTLVSRISKSAHLFINSLSIKTTRVPDTQEEALLADNPHMTREAMKKEDVGIQSII